MVNSTTASSSSSWQAPFSPLSSGLCTRNLGSSFYKYLNLPVIFASIAYVPPGTPINYVPWVLVCFLFNFRVHA